MQTHPNVDKALWNGEGLLGLKQPNKPFPLKQEVGVLKWRMQTTDESLMPLSGELGEGECVLSEWWAYADQCMYEWINVCVWQSIGVSQNDYFS